MSNQSIMIDITPYLGHVHRAVLLLVTWVVILRTPGRSMLRIAGVERTVQSSGRRR